MATAAATSAARETLPKFRYLSAWFCPYAHRATLALEHHHGRVDYEWVEALVRRIDETEIDRGASFPYWTSL